MGPPGRPPAARADAGQEVAYSKRLLLKSLLRAIALASYAPSSGPRPQVCAQIQDSGLRVAASLRRGFQKLRPVPAALELQADKAQPLCECLTQHPDWLALL